MWGLFCDDYAPNSEKETNEVGEKVTVRWEGPFNEAKDDAEMYCLECDYNLDYGAEDWNYCPDCGAKLIYR